MRIGDNLMPTIPIVIPTYEPDDRFIALLKGLISKRLTPIIVIDDGSGNKYKHFFEKAERIISNNGVILTHLSNKGKGAALKTGFNYILQNFSNAIGCITIDSDGQHSVDCIIKVKETFEKNPHCLILGTRLFTGNNIPWKSKFGNIITKHIFSFFTGLHLSDTQTGLRCVPYSFLNDLIKIPENRFEFETQMLIQSISRYSIIETPIKTIYDSVTNHSTHFNPIADSWKIYKIIGSQFLKYFLSSVSSFVLDVLLFWCFCKLLKNNFSESYLIFATILARCLSFLYNFIINYKLVFCSKSNKFPSFLKYFFLAAVIMGISALSVHILWISFHFYSEVFNKIVIDSILFIITFKLQKNWVFKN